MPTTTTDPATTFDDEIAARLAHLETLPDAFLQCRAIGHDDEIVTGYGVKTWDEQLGAEVVMRSWAWLERNCRRCSRSVLTTYDQYFSQPHSRPHYPDGYLFKHLGRGKPSEARRVFWRRQAGTQPPD
jgi:hypothetical protein